MKIVTCSELRKNARLYFDKVEGGESIEVYRHGKLIAVINPVNRKARNWWKKAEPLKINGAELSAAILAERND